MAPAYITLIWMISQYSQYSGIKHAHVDIHNSTM